MDNQRCLESTGDLEVRTRLASSVEIVPIRGVAYHMKSFSYFFGLVLREFLLCHTDNLSRTLQKSLSASEVQLVADMIRSTLQSMQKEQNFDLFWDKVKRMAEDKDVNDPVLPRKVKCLNTLR